MRHLEHRHLYLLVFKIAHFSAWWWS